MTLTGRLYKQIPVGSLLEGCCYSGNNTRIMLRSYLSLCGIQRDNVG